MNWAQKAVLARKIHKMGGNVVWAEKDQDLTNYLNSKSTTSGNVSEQRTKDQVTDISVFGHGYSSSVEPGHGGDDAMHKQYSWGIDDANQLKPEAFNNPNWSFYTCNAATDKNVSTDPKNPEYKNLVEVVSDQTNGTATGYQGQTTYKYIWNEKSQDIWDIISWYIEPGYYDKRMNPSDNLPKGGDSGATEHTYNNGTEVKKP